MSQKGFGTAPVFFTAISTILGAILFLRFGYAVGTLGFLGTLIIIALGHLVTIPTALAISELATNQKVEGGGEYFIISRSFGMNIGATIGIALFFSQAISVAFYVIAFTEAFEPLFNLASERFNLDLPRQVISLPAMGALALLILRKGADLGVQALYVVVGILFLALLFFFLGDTPYSDNKYIPLLSSRSFRNMDDLFIVFAIIFPAFTGMTAGVGLSGDLKNPKRSIPIGTMAGTIGGMIVYVFIAWKLAISASPSDLINNQLIMADVALYGAIVIPVGLAASTISSAIGSILVAPRTLQALGADQVFFLPAMNKFLASGKGDKNEPYNTTLVTCVIAFIFVALGDVNVVAQVISMFFMVTYGSLNLISFLYHFGADPSYRPSFRSFWPLSLLGFVLCAWLMFMISTPYAIAAIIMMSLIYIGISYRHKDQKGLESIFQGAIFQLSRNLQIYLQKANRNVDKDIWRPSVVCISRDTFNRKQAFNLLRWISHKYGFGTYIHLIDGYFSKSTEEEAGKSIGKLIEYTEEKNSKVYVDTIISPSYTSAIAQLIQLPSISGKANNIVLFEFAKDNMSNLEEIIENYSLVRAGRFDTCILGSSQVTIAFKKGIHVWITSQDYENTNLMLLISYVMLGHPDWRKGSIKLFDVGEPGELESRREKLLALVHEGQLPISAKNIEFIDFDENTSIKTQMTEKSADAGLTVVGIRGEQVKNQGREVFTGYEGLGNVLFVNAFKETDIK